MIGLLEGADLSDNDRGGIGDGIPDIFETEGMRLANGRVIYTDPEMMDTDGDGLEDGLEINCKMCFNEDDQLEDLLKEYSLGELVDACYFKMKSDPTLKDTDGDGLNDDVDENPLDFDLAVSLVNNIEKLEQLAKFYNKNYGDELKEKDKIITCMFIRQFNYDYADPRWDGIAEKVDYGFVTFVKNNNGKLYDYFLNTKYISLNKEEKLDLYHMFATMGAYFHQSDYSDGFQYGAMPEKHINSLAGWAGDLQTLMIQAVRKTNDQKDYNVFKNAMDNLIGTDESCFSMDDAYADMDAYNIYCLAKRKSISSAMRDYYSKGHKKRYTSFVGQWVNLNSCKDELKISKNIKNSISLYTEYKYFIKVWPLFEERLDPNDTNSPFIVISDEQARAAADSFTEFIMKGVINEKNY